MSKKRLIEYLVITSGVIALAIAFYFFLQPLNLVTGGVLGIGILIEKWLPFPVSIFVFIMNMIALVTGGLVLGKQFFYRTIYGTVLLPLIIFILELTADPGIILNEVDPNQFYLIGSIFAGILTGAGLGLVIRNNATTGGMDVFQKIISKKTRLPFSIVLILTDGIVISFGLFQNVNSGLFALLSLIITSVMINYVSIAGKNSYTGFIITSNENEEIFKNEIYKRLDRGFTKVKAVGGYTDMDKTMIICTVYRHQIYILKELIFKIDPNAFSIIMHTNEVIGSGFKISDQDD